MIPCCDNKLRTVSEGCAPFANHCNANSSLIETQLGLVVGCMFRLFDETTIVVKANQHTMTVERIFLEPYVLNEF